MRGCPGRRVCVPSPTGPPGPPPTPAQGAARSPQAQPALAPFRRDHSTKTPCPPFRDLPPSPPTVKPVSCEDEEEIVAPCARMVLAYSRLAACEETPFTHTPRRRHSPAEGGVRSPRSTPPKRQGKKQVSDRHPHEVVGQGGGGGAYQLGRTRAWHLAPSRSISLHLAPSRGISRHLAASRGASSARSLPPPPSSSCGDAKSTAVCQSSSSNDHNS